MTLGPLEGDAQKLAMSFGGTQLEKCKAGYVVRCMSHNVVTTPAFMDDHATPGSVFTGIDMMVKQLRKIVEGYGHLPKTCSV